MENKTNMEKEKEEVKEELDVFHYHELMDRIAVAGQHLQTFILDHPVLEEEKNVALLLKAERASELLGDLYSEVGELFFKMLDGEEENKD